MRNFKLCKLNSIPKSKKDLRKLIGYLNFNRPYVKNLSGLLANVIAWSYEDQQILEKIAAVINENQALTIPKPDAEFGLFTDASDTGISGVLLQDGNLVRLFSRKLRDSVNDYIVVQKKELAIVASLKNFREIVGTTLMRIKTDNKNITFLEGSTSRQRKLRSQLANFNVKLSHVAGSDNKAAVFLSRNFLAQSSPSFSLENVSQYASEITENDITLKTVNGITLPFDSKQRLVIPVRLIDNFLYTMYYSLGHPGMSKMKNTLKDYFSFPDFNHRIESFCESCLLCAKNKHQCIPKGSIQGYFSSTSPKSKVSSDIFGPLPGHFYNVSGSIHILTISDIFSRYTLLVYLQPPTSQNVAQEFDQRWISRFGAPQELIVDNGKQYIGQPLQSLCARYGIRIRYCSPYNPTANSISERLNQTLGVVFRTNKGSDLARGLQIAERALNCTHHRNLGTTPEAVLLGRSSIDPLKRRTNADIAAISQRIASAAKKENERNNTKRKAKVNYKLHDKVLIRIKTRSKLDPNFEGPFTIIAFSQNPNKALLEADGYHTWRNKRTSQA